MADYALENVKWGSRTLGTPGGTVTWALDATVPRSFEATIVAAFALWSQLANIQFQEVGATAGAGIVFTDATIDGPSNTLGVTNYGYSNGVLRAGVAIRLDSGENWHLAADGSVVSADGTSLKIVAAHEIGHAIGLDHYNAAPALMNAYLNRAVTGPTESDIHGVQAIYGAAAVASAPASVTPVAAVPVSSAPVSSGSASAAPASPTLVDATWYRQHYPDVAAAGMDPVAHYNQNGWHEGRDPNAFFSTTGYLAANPSIAASGVNPLDHFMSSAWKTGSDPSAAFDDELYLLHNPDVKAAGVNPLGHYLQYGAAEGRAAYGAIGPASSFTHGSFDAEYYLLANPDVAKAALASGGDTFAFAFQHFDTNGWREGRNPNAEFDTKGYLAAYRDVAAANMDPLTHYDQWGWTEGRDPSGHFDTKAYEAHYADVAAAHVDPLTHYLQNGAMEGRSTYADGHFFAL